VRPSSCSFGCLSPLSSFVPGNIPRERSLLCRALPTHRTDTQVGTSRQRRLTSPHPPPDAERPSTRLANARCNRPGHRQGTRSRGASRALPPRLSRRHAI